MPRTTCISSQISYHHRLFHFIKLNSKILMYSISLKYHFLKLNSKIILDFFFCLSYQFLEPFINLCSKILIDCLHLKSTIFEFHQKNTMTVQLAMCTNVYLCSVVLHVRVDQQIDDSKKYLQIKYD